eukprot:gb/GFBE01045863.1/.p1 GENE.gb/GFBE01045863.1/~~gb/GFBE01045863.1/.p1  ORF type:complete len:885 (+),score=280.28 gb/GFBE01045863.1/:1-2655(+)
MKTKKTKKSQLKSSKRPKAKAEDDEEKEEGGAEEVTLNAASRVDPTSVFVRGLPEGTTDKDLRIFLEARAGPTVTCFAIRGDYGIAKFRKEEDARRALEELQGSDFGGSTLRLEVGKPKRGAPAPGGKSRAPDEDGAAPEERRGSVHLRSVQLRGLPSNASKDAVQAWIEEQLPGGCGIESIRRVLGESGQFAISFRKDQNAKRALEVLNGADMQGSTVSASLRALELSRQSSKAGRLIVRNLAFDAREKHVRKAFQQVGEISDVHLPSKAGGAPGAHRGFAFVQYAEAASAERAVAELNGTKICGRGVAVDWSVDASVYTSLQREEQPQLKPEKPEKKNTRQPAEDDEDDDEGEEEEDEDEEEEDEEEDDEKEREEEGPDAELKRMKELLGQDVEEDDDDDDDDDEEEDSAKNKKAKAKEATKKSKKKDKDNDKERAPGYDIDQGRTVFVRNVPFDAGEDDLKEVFRRYGKVGSIKLVPDRSGQNAHRGSAFIKFAEASGAQAALATEAEAEKKLKELSSVVKRSDQRELPAVEGFGVSLKGRRLVLKPAVNPQEASELSDKSKPQKGQAAKERMAWMHLLNVGDISESDPKWQQLSKSEQRQRQEGRKERKWRVNNPNFTIHPQRLSIRNLPTHVDATKLREKVVKHLSEVLGPEGAGKKARMKEAQEAIMKASLVRDSERRTESNERRSKGFGFIAFKDHASAMKTLQFLNDNPRVFGGNRRPIVEFAVEDKRKLRMQEELLQKFKKKLGAKEAKGEAGAEIAEGAAAKKKRKKRSAKTADGEEASKKLSRGQRQREKRRAQKAAAEERSKVKAEFQSRKAKMQEMAAKQRQADRQRPKRPTSSVPDSGAPEAKRKKQRTGELADDFELRAMERFRRGGKL